jgi:hypothetical protein
VDAGEAVEPGGGAERGGAVAYSSAAERGGSGSAKDRRRHCVSRAPVGRVWASPNGIWVQVRSYDPITWTIGCPVSGIDLGGPVPDI